MAAAGEGAALIAERDEPRAHEAWGGRHKFACGGRLVLGPHSTSVLPFTLLLVLGPSVALFASVIPGSGGGAVMASAYGCVLAWVLFSLFRAATTDPGIVPRGNVPPPPPPDADEVAGAARELTEQQRAEAEVRQKYCHTCRIYRPPRAKHCRSCDCCVREMDHHCPWVGGCVGQRNYRWFVSFVLATTAYTLMCVGAAAADITREADRRETGSFLSRAGSAMSDRPLASFVLLYGLFMALSLSGLACYHCSIIGRNETTNEQIRRVHRNGNPHDRGGCLANWGRLCDPVPPPEIDWGGPASAMEMRDSLA